MKYDFHLLAVTEAMTTEMPTYEKSISDQHHADHNAREVIARLDTLGRPLAALVAKRIRAKIGKYGCVGVSVTCRASVDHRNYTVRPYLKIDVSCKAMVNGTPTAAGTFNGQWDLHNPTKTNIEAVIGQVVQCVAATR